MESIREVNTVQPKKETVIDAKVEEEGWEWEQEPEQKDQKKKV